MEADVPTPEELKRTYGSAERPCIQLPSSYKQSRIPSRTTHLHLLLTPDEGSVGREWSGVHNSSSGLQVV